MNHQDHQGQFLDLNNENDCFYTTCKVYIQKAEVHKSLCLKNGEN